MKYTEQCNSCIRVNIFPLYRQGERYTVSQRNYPGTQEHCWEEYPREGRRREYGATDCV